MAGSWAGAYGAGAASEELHRLLAERFEREKFSEHQRQSQSDETFRQSESRKRDERETARDALAREDRMEDRRRYEGEQVRADSKEKVRREERAEDREWGLDDREDSQAAAAEGRKQSQDFTAGENQKTRSFQSYMDSRRAAREASSTDSEPLVAIKDPATGQPRLVPRSQAVNATPASTRDQALTEGQSNAAGFADRMKFNEQPIQAYEGSVGRGSQLMALLPGEMQSDGFRQYATAKKNWIAAQLRKESGAAISQGEYDEADRQYFPQPGDSPAVVQQKRQLRTVAQESMRRSSGSAGLEQGAGQAPGSTASPRQVRTIRNRATGETRQQTSTDGGATWN